MAAHVLSNLIMPMYNFVTRPTLNWPFNSRDLILLLVRSRNLMCRAPAVPDRPANMFLTAINGFENIETPWALIIPNKGLARIALPMHVEFMHPYLRWSAPEFTLIPF